MLLIFKGGIIPTFLYIKPHYINKKTICFKFVLPTEIFASEYIHIPVVINNYLSTTIDLLCASKEIIYYVSTY